MKKLIVAGALAGAVFAANAETVCTWTGAENAYWTNANNWAEGIVPGQYKDASGGTAPLGDLEYVAEFGAVVEGAATTINLDGQYAVARVTVKSGAPYYVFGLSTSQIFSFKPKVSSGTAYLIVEQGAAAPRITARYGALGTGIGTHQIENWSNGELVFDKYGYNDAHLNNNHYTFAFAGSGDIRISSVGTHYFLMYDHKLMMTGGKLYIDCQILDTPASGEFWSKTTVPSGYSCEIVLGDNGRIGTYNMYGDWEIKGALRVTGTGVFALMSGATKDSGSQSVPCNVGGSLVIDVPTAPFNTTTYARAGWHAFSGSGTVAFNSAGSFTGDVNILCPGTVKTGLIGMTGETSNIGSGAVRICDSGRFFYSGPGETTDRQFCLTNSNIGTANTGKGVKSAIGIIEQGGAGKLTITSSLESHTAAAGGATLILANSTSQDAEWAGVLPDGASSVLNVTKCGTGKWILSGENTYTGATTIEGGTLEIAAGGSIAASSGLVTAGTAKLAVADGETVEVQAITQKTAGSGALDVFCGEGAALKCAGLPAGPAPSWLTVNGMAAEVKSDGTLAPNLTAWKAATSGAWSVADNWDNGLPSTAKSAFIDKTGDYTVTVEEAAGTVGSVTLTGGNLAIAADMAVQDGVLSVGEGTTLSHTDGTLALNTSAAGKQLFRMEGGTADLSGGTITLGSSSGIGGSGTVNLSGTHAITSANHIQVAADAGQTLELSSTGSSDERSFSASGENRFRLGGVAGGITKLMTKRAPVKGYIQYGYSLEVGYQAGLAEVTVAGSQYAYFQGGGNGGVRVGAGDPVGAQIAPTGVVNVTGGQFLPGGVGFWFMDYWGGLCVGDGVTVRDGYGSRVTGFLNQSAGICAPSGTFGIGIGCADGCVMQTGGSFSYSGSSTWNSNPTRYHPMVVGYAGGDGSYVISNGTATVKNGAIFVGGCLAKDLGRYYGLSTTYVQSGKGDSVGLLAARGGTFTQTYASGIIVGADGTGRLEVGPAGTLTTPYLAISNNVSGTLAFELGADGKAGTLVATNLTIAAGAKLVVDARGAKRLGTWTKLASLENAPVGAFAAGDVTVLVNDAYAERFANPEVFYERNGEKGVFLKGEDIGLTVIVR